MKSKIGETITIVFWIFELKNPGDIQVESLNSWVWVLEERFLEVVIYILCFFYKLLILLSFYCV